MSGRLAPTPSGHLHLGNALAFGAAALMARRGGHPLLLRVEDLDRGRAREEVAAAQRADLRWLGIEWAAETAPQSTRNYSLDGLPVYRCDCSRAARLAGACPHRERPAATGAWRLRCDGAVYRFDDAFCGPQAWASQGDPILLRADGEPAYPLAVVLDDLRDGVTEVVRGADLLEATAVQLQLYAALGQPPPRFAHVPVLLGPDGKKLSKSHGSTELRALRAAGWTADRVWAALLPFLGMPPGPLFSTEIDPARVPPGPAWAPQPDGPGGAAAPT